MPDANVFLWTYRDKAPWTYRDRPAEMVLERNAFHRGDWIYCKGKTKNISQKIMRG